MPRPKSPPGGEDLGLPVSSPETDPEERSRWMQTPAEVRAAAAPVDISQVTSDGAAAWLVKLPFSVAQRLRECDESLIFAQMDAQTNTLDIIDPEMGKMALKLDAVETRAPAMVFSRTKPDIDPTASAMLAKSVLRDPGKLRFGGRITKILHAVTSSKDLTAVSAMLAKFAEEEAAKRVVQRATGGPRGQVTLVTEVGKEDEAVPGIDARERNRKRKAAEDDEDDGRDKRVRVQRTVLERRIFELFEEQKEWGFGEMNERVKQPETYLRQVLSEIATFHRKGDNRNKWTLKADLQL